MKLIKHPFFILVFMLPLFHSSQLLYHIIKNSTKNKESFTKTLFVESTLDEFFNSKPFYSLIDFENEHIHSRQIKLHICLIITHKQ